LIGFLVDTNVVSESRRRRPDPLIVEFLASVPFSQLFVSEITFAEIRFGIGKLGDADRRAGLEVWLEHELRPSFVGRTLSLNEDILLRWRRSAELGRQAGRPYSEPDLLLAATAMEHGLTLVTRNVKDFRGLDLTVLNPWEGRPYS
jgi:predicted nucleic acid-binding protein